MNPPMPMPEDPEITVLRRIAAFGLIEDGARLRTTGVPWGQLVVPLVAQRLTGLALAATESGWLELEDEQTTQLLERHRGAMFQALGLERWLLTVSEAFDRAGIEHVVLKGPALAHTIYPDPSWRPFADLDLLVRGSTWKEACAVLASLGFRRDLPEPGPGFDQRFGKAASHTAPDGLSLDLHRTLVVGPFGLWMDPEELFERTVALPLGGRVLRRLDDTALLLHACMHASLGWGEPLLMPARDVAQVALKADVDWKDLADLAPRWRLATVVHHAFQTARELFGVDLPDQAGMFDGQRTRRREQRALAAYTTDRRGRGGTAVWTLRAIPGVRGKAAYVRALLFPSREFLAARATRGRASYFRRWAIPVRWLGRRPGG